MDRHRHCPAPDPTTVFITIFVIVTIFVFVIVSVIVIITVITLINHSDTKQQIHQLKQKHCQRHNGPRHCFYNLNYLSSYKAGKFTRKETSKLNTSLVPIWNDDTTIISSKSTHQMAPL